MDNLTRDTSHMREVTQDEFYKAIGPCVRLHTAFVDDKWPYASVFTTEYGSLRGKRIGYLPEDSALEKMRFFLPS